jgi:DNA-binding NarL/FixJ family response regulator
VNDYQVVREGIKLMLNVPSADVQVVGEAASFQELFAVLPDTESNIVLLDLLFTRHRSGSHQLFKRALPGPESADSLHDGSGTLCRSSIDSCRGRGP